MKNITKQQGEIKLDTITKLNIVIDTLGVRQAHIEQTIGIRLNTLYYYKKGLRKLSPCKLEKLKELLTHYNV